MLRTTSSLTHGQALVEAGRCLGCHQAPCASTCPVHVDVPGFIQRFREENLAGASELIYGACALGQVCGNACPTSVLCEGACVLPGLGQPAVRIGALQAHVTAAWQPPEPFEPRAHPMRAGTAAVVGAGPAGLGCAVELHRRGHTVHVFERRGEAGGMVSRVIPAHRLPGEAVALDLSRLLASGIQFNFNQAVDALLAQRMLADYDAVFLAAGMSGAQDMQLAGLPAAGVHQALDLLASARRAEPLNLGQRVVVIGAGNVALDAAVVARRGGAQVIVLYRRSKDEMPGWESEYLEACQLGVEFRWLSVAQEALSRGGRLSGLRVQPMRFSSQMAGGRRWVEPDPAQPPYELACDGLVLALGQALEAESAAAFGLPLSGGLIQTSPGSSRSAVRKVFAAGEAVSGGSTIVACLAAGKAAAAEIDAWLGEEGGAHD